MKLSKIQWTDATWNPWVGCSKVSAGCTNCYAEGLAKRLKVPWGQGQPRRLSKNWETPRAWDRAAARRKTPLRVFPSMCDPFDPEVPEKWRDDFFDLIGETPSLDWLLLTKRPKEALAYRRSRGGLSWPIANLWIGVSCEDQKTTFERIPILWEIPALVRFVSFEPLLASIHLPRSWPFPETISWVILGGESGPRARPCQMDWLRHLVVQCRDFNGVSVPVFVKQLGRRPMQGRLPVYLNDPKGGVPEEWPADLRIREQPE